jgi:hypothetical protein
MEQRPLSCGIIMSNSDFLFPSHNPDASEAPMRGWLEAFVRGFS